METPFNADRLSLEQLRKEGTEVREELLAALAELTSPLGEMVRSQLEHSLSSVRVAILLAAASGEAPLKQTYQQRIRLSSALEMLYLALRIHKLLLSYSQNHDDHRPDRAWTGTIILAGDYCFSRSAILAAQTDLPSVVDIFARALKSVSEELLRRLFPTSGELIQSAFDEDVELVGAGLRAATIIAGLDEQTRLATIAYGQKLFKQLTTTPLPTTFSLEPPTTVAAFQRARWRALLALHSAPATR